MGFHDKLNRAWATSGSMLCVGLDPDPAKIPAHLEGPDAIFRFCADIADATADLACAFKPQISCADTALARHASCNRVAPAFKGFTVAWMLVRDYNNCSL